MDQHVLHGYSMKDISLISRESVMMHRNWMPSEDIDYLIEIAWEGVVTELCASADKPERNDLYYAGYKAAKDEVRCRAKMRGTPEARSEPTKTGRARNTGGQFERFWVLLSKSDFPEDAVIDRIAFGQIWHKMYWLNRQTLTVLAICNGDNASAASMLDVSKRQMEARLHRAREEFQKFWYEHENPPKKQIWRRTLPPRDDVARQNAQRARLAYLGRTTDESPKKDLPLGASQMAAAVLGCQSAMMTHVDAC